MRRRSSGFTLIELLVVVAIIAVLIAILLPALGRARDRAKTVDCMTNMHTIFVATQVYSNENNGFMLPCYLGTLNGKYDSDHYAWYGRAVLGPLVGIDYVDETNKAMVTNATNRLNKLLTCPSVLHPANNPCSQDYTYNSNMGYNSADVSVSPWAYPAVKKDLTPPQTLLMMDLRDVNNAWYEWSFDSVYTQLAPTGYTPGSDKNRAGTPHEGHKKANMAFMDGSIVLGDPNKMSASGYNWIANMKVDVKGNLPFPY